jgi:hypothetical protein
MKLDGDLSLPGLQHDRSLMLVLAASHSAMTPGYSSQQ